MSEVVRVACPHRIGLAHREGGTLSLLPCDCNEPSTVREVVSAVLPDAVLRTDERAAIRAAYALTATGGYAVLYRAVARIVDERMAQA